MAYLTKIGHVESNIGKIGSRGYHVYRRGDVVWSLWGPVDVVRSRFVAICLGPHTKALIRVRID